ncbi:MAG: Rieske 2Fe-2S domain-containing protein [Ilumatobacteraceae bacterium]
MPPEVAEQLIVLGFFDEVISQLPDTPLRASCGYLMRASCGHGPALAGGIGGPDEGRRLLVRRVRGQHARKVEAEGRLIAVVRIDDRVYAIGDTCSHADISLSEGEVICETAELECWKHGSAFSLETGEPQTLPATQPVPVSTQPSKTAWWWSAGHEHSGDPWPPESLGQRQSRSCTASI